MTAPDPAPGTDTGLDDLEAHVASLLDTNADGVAWIDARIARELIREVRELRAEVADLEAPEATVRAAEAIARTTGMAYADALESLVYLSGLRAEVARLERLCADTTGS